MHEIFLLPSWTSTSAHTRKLSTKRRKASYLPKKLTYYVTRKILKFNNLAPDVSVFLKISLSPKISCSWIIRVPRHPNIFCLKVITTPEYGPLSLNLLYLMSSWIKMEEYKEFRSIFWHIAMKLPYFLSITYYIEHDRQIGS